MGFGATKTSASRNHIVMANGLYDLNNDQEYIGSQNTPAQRLIIHGSGSRVQTTSDTSAITIQVDAVIRDLEVVSSSSAIEIETNGQSRLERLRVHSGSRGISVAGSVLMRDVFIEDTAYAVVLSANARLTLDRGVIKNPYVGIRAGLATVVDISNLLVFGAADVALDLANSAGGTVSFTTIADSGTDSGSGPRAFRCSPSGLTVRSSIIWAPGTVVRPAIDGGCMLSSTIVGPTAVPGATNVDPRFVDAASGNYHLAAGSPAREMVDIGPALDFEGEPRPRGARFDIGADEAP
jgi:hypothetical protein